MLYYNENAIFVKRIQGQVLTLDIGDKKEFRVRSWL